MNKLVVIGWLGVKTAYLNVEVEDAINRYCAANNMSRLEFDECTFGNDYFLSVIEFDDEIGVYDVWNN